MLKYQLRKNLSKKDISKVLDAINNSSNFTRYKLRELQKYINKGTIITSYYKNDLCGVITYKLFNKNWIEISTFIVFPRYRNKGHGKELWNQTIKKFSKKNIFILTNNHLVKNEFILSSGFIQERFIKLPFIVKKFFVSDRIKLHKLAGLWKKRNGKKGKINYFTREANQT